MNYRFSSNGKKYIYDSAANAVRCLNKEARSSFRRSFQKTEVCYGDLIFVELTRRCNLSCGYCYLNTTDSERREKNSTDQKYRSITSKLDEILYKRKDARISFYGGEPILEYELLEKITSYCDNKNINDGYAITYAVVTNGTLFDDSIINFLIDKQFLVTISIDGDRGTMLENRGVKDLQNIERAIGKMCKAGLFIEVIATMQRSNHSDFSHNIEYLLNLPVHSIKFVACDSLCANCSLDSKEARRFSSLLEVQVEKMLEKGDYEKLKKMSGLMDAIRKIDSGLKIEHHCGYGEKVLAVSYDGNLYPCPSFLGNRAFQITEGKIPYPQKRQPCEKCVAYSTCHGNCYYANHISSKNPGDSMKAKCIINKTIAKLALKTYATLYLSQYV